MSTMRSRLTPFVILLLYMCTYFTAHGCDSGWFGLKCQFKCHCESTPNCDVTTGQCQSPSKCSTGWFGSSCQYKDLMSDSIATINNSPSQTSYSWITDKNDASCNSDASLTKLNITFQWKLPFTWLRLSLNDTEYLGSLTLSFTNSSSNINCMDQRIYFINKNTIDIRCKVIVDTTSVIIEGRGVKSLCSLYISGGRNVALKQNATQTSTYQELGDDKIASKAVDGNTNGIFNQNSCTHTSTDDTNPSWNVTFEHEQVLNRVILYNRNDLGIRLQHFILQAFDTKSIAYGYQDERTDFLPIYYVNFTVTESEIPVTGLTVHFNGSKTILTLCEVEAYGDCVPGSWGLECDKKCNSNCGSTCNVETGTCHVCNGFNNPPECDTLCAPGMWGVNCTSPCSKDCWNGSCKHTSGQCDKGCNGYKNPPDCNQACTNGMWGFNCGSKCNGRCWENSCDTISGLCDKGCIGYQDFPSCSRVCDRGWFGKNCQFKCHCAGDCESITGQCLSNPTCLTGWFGSSCQYADLVSIPSATINASPVHLLYDWITDRNESTCNTDDSLENVTVSWSTSITFTWLRVTLSSPVYLGRVAVSFITTTTKLTCIDQNIYVLNTKTIDIRCKAIVNTTSVIIEGQGVKSLCSLYISGGRNFALKQKAAQSSTLFYYNVDQSASHAVDGNTNGTFSNNTCTHTDDLNPSWNVTFDQPQVLNRIILYNRKETPTIDDYLRRLQNFTLEILYANKTVFLYQDQSNEPIAIYNVNLQENKNSSPVIGLTINLQRSNSNILTLCEVEAYGECVPGTWDLYCDKKCNTTCISTCSVENGACQACNGHKDPPICNAQCSQGKWGLNCNNNCDTKCLENSCNSVTGVCDKACNGFKDFPNCSKECDPMTWGPNCTSHCNASCFNSSCDKVTGVCNLGCNGYSNPNNCTTACVKEKWGLNCSKSCPASCWNKSCNRSDGTCDEGCNGYKDFPNCTKECDPGEFGLNCTNQCDNCYNKTCSSQTGLCNDGCDGFSDPPNCSIPCNHGLWGLNCSQACKENCFNDSCDRKTGLCDEGCDGYKNPPNCDDVCSPGMWGMNCTRPCRENCWGRSCKHTSGQCDKGCNGYKNPPDCTQDCDDGYWSLNCSVRCSIGCLNASCDRLTSECHQGCHAGYSPPSCESGCKEGYYGINCSYQCSSNCSNNECNSTVGHCLKCIQEHTGHFCEALIVASPPDDPTPIGAIVGSIIAVIVISVLIFAGVMLWRRNRASKRTENDDGDVDDANESKRLSNVYQTKFSSLQKKHKGSSNEDETDNSNSNGQGIYNNEGTHGNLQNTSIAIKELYSFMHSHNKDYFEQQFKNIPVPKNVTTEVGMGSLNKHKNRYKNICTYDHSRVHLEINTAKNEGDYINASYIKGLKKQDQFIASQGPNNIMLNDFIRMLWEQQVDKVVMLTNLIEEGTVKCEKYWPDEATKQFGEIQMKMISTQTFSDYVIRVLELSKPSEAGRIFTQFHFTSWPDKGVPSVPWGLVDFEQRVSAKPTSRPIVVHCSAGVGRTGTYIALSNVLREAEEMGRIDFFKTVTRLRQDRVLMIQTAEQYWFLHRAAQVAIVCIGTTVTSNDIVGRIKILDERSTTGKTKLEEEFKAVCEVCNDFVEEPQNVEDSTTEDGNVYNNIEEMADRSKNRFISIIPKQKYRPFLACENQNMADYINAVFLPGFKKKDQQLLTQLPMPKTIIDFWRMVTQYKVSLIVAFEIDAMANDETFGQYLPAGVDKTLNCSPYLVRINDIKSSSLCEEQKLTVEMEKQKSLLSLSSNDQTSVIHLKCLFTDYDPVKLLRFIRQVRSYNALANGRILYTCSNGAKYSGLACVLSLLLDRMEHDSCLTVPLVVGTIKTIRPDVISTLDQYRVLYQVLQRYSNNSVQYERLWSVAGNSAVLSTTKNPAFDETQDTDANIYANV